MNFIISAGIRFLPIFIMVKKSMHSWQEKNRNRLSILMIAWGSDVVKRGNHFMRSKIQFVFCFYLLLSSTGCGKINSDTNQKSNTVSDSNSEAVTSIDTESGQVKIEEVAIRISNVQINADTKAVRLEAEYSENGQLPTDSGIIDEYVINSLNQIQIKANEDSYTVIWSGFYNDLDEIENLSFGGVGIAENKKYTCHINNITKVDEKQFGFDKDNAHIDVKITPFSVTITSNGVWKNEDDFFNLIATMKNGEKEFIINLPTVDNRKSSEKKNDPVSDDEIVGMMVLGDGLSFARCLDYDGIEYITNELIDISQIESVDLLQYHGSGLGN